MKAMVRHKYRARDALRLEEIPKPTPGDDEVLIEVRAASANAGDWELLMVDPIGQFIIVQIVFRFAGGGLLKPQFKILGSDVAGHVEAVGGNVEQFQPGDEVFGDITGSGLGAFAEYVCVPESAVLVKKPASLSFEEAAALPQVAAIALQGLRYNGELQEGQKVLINGGGGGAGTLAIQIAKSLGAEVTAVDSTKKLELLRLLGADHVVDYTQEDFTRRAERYDLILDLAGHRSILDCKHALTPEGAYAFVGGSTLRLLQTLVMGLFARSVGQRVGVLAVEPNKRDLATVTELLETGKVVPVIDRTYPLSEVAEALRYLGEGHALGKVVIKV